MRKLKLFVLLVTTGLAACARAPDPAQEVDRALAYLKEDKPAKAAAHFERALTAAPPTPQLLNHLAVCQLRIGETAAAITNLLAALRLDEAYPAAHFNLGVAFLETGQPNEAIAHLRQAARATAPPPNAPYYLGLAYASAHAWAQAGESLATHLKTSQGTPELSNLLGIIHTRQREFKDAERCFRQALDQDPEFAHAYLNLATLEHQSLDKPRDAMLHYQKYLDLAPKADNRDSIHQRIIEIAHQLEAKSKPVVVAPVAPPTPRGSDTPVATVTTPPATSPPPPPRGSDVPVTTAPLPTPPPAPTPTVKTRPPSSTEPLRAGNRARATAFFTTAVQAHHATNLTAAIAGYINAINADPSFAAAYYNLAIAHRASGQPENALENYELALRAKPDYTDARFNYAILLAEQGYVADAIDQYQTILQSNPNDATAHLSLASLYARDRAAVAKARHHYETYLRLAPRSPLARDIRRWLDANR